LEGKNLLVVGATDHEGKVASFSNTGPKSVDVMTVGTGIRSTCVGGGCIHMTGTSVAAPEVTKRITRILSAAPSITAEEAIEELLKTAESKRELTDAVRHGRVLAPSTPADPWVAIGLDAFLNGTARRDRPQCPFGKLSH